MEKEFRGRVFEVYRQADRLCIELAVESDWHLFWTTHNDLLSSIRPGQFVSLKATPEKEIISLKNWGGPEQVTSSSLSDTMRWRKNGRIEKLKARHKILSAIREDLYQEGFLEVETPLLVKATCPENIDALEVGGGYLVTSTEYQIKRLLVGGLDRVFTLTKNFRSGDVGRFHSAEFTMLEWGRTFETLETIEQDTVRFIRKAFCKLYPHRDSLSFNGHKIDFMKAPWEHLTVRQGLERHLGLKQLGDFSLEPLLNACREANIELPETFRQDKYLLTSYLLDLLQTHLGKSVPTFLHEWPAYFTASAPLHPDDPHVAIRTELYIGGVEMANGFPFLRDAALQRTLFAEGLATRKAFGKPEIALDRRYLESLDQGLPPGAGMALGMDRLVMVLTESAQLSNVQAFSWDEV